MKHRDPKLVISDFVITDNDQQSNADTTITHTYNLRNKRKINEIDNVEKNQKSTRRRIYIPEEDDDENDREEDNNDEENDGSDGDDVSSDEDDDSIGDEDDDSNDEDDDSNDEDDDDDSDDNNDSDNENDNNEENDSDEDDTLVSSIRSFLSNRTGSAKQLCNWYYDKYPECNKDRVKSASLILLSQPWYKKLTIDSKRDYLVKLVDLYVPSSAIPNMQQLLDINVSKTQRQKLITSLIQLESIEESFSVEYYTAAQLLISQYEYHLHNPTVSDTEINVTLRNFVPLDEKIKNSSFSDGIKSTLYDRLQLAESCSKGSEEYAKHVKWIETVLALPQKTMDTSFGGQDFSDPRVVSDVMGRLAVEFDKNIYGMKEAKMEMLYTLAGIISNPNSRNKAIGLCGPPGIGKTMIVDVISNVLGIPNAKIMLGGVNDSNYLEGHDATYVQSQAGLIVHSITNMGCTNGIIYFDELDKISKTPHGKEIEHCLLHITDFTQNHEFRDKYLREIPIDLSNYIFIYSMNDTSHIDTALLSRIPVFYLDGYTVSEKESILRHHILPATLNNYRFNQNDVTFTAECIKYLASNVPEQGMQNGKSGVRGLKAITDQIMKRVQLYRLAYYDGKLPFEVDLKIDNYQLPLKITREMVEPLVNRIDNTKTQIEHRMYV